MAAKKIAAAKKVVAAAPVNIAAVMSGKENALSDFARQAAGVLHLCFDLAADANLSPDQQNLFWELGSRAVQIMLRIRDQWTLLLERSPPTSAQLQTAANRLSQAAASLTAARTTPTAQNLFTAATQTSSALDMADAMIDLVS